jgi:hypothetical protein
MKSEKNKINQHNNTLKYPMEQTPKELSKDFAELDDIEIISSLEEMKSD